MLKRSLLIGVLMVFVIGCSASPYQDEVVPNESERDIELLISAAVSLTDSLHEIKTSFEQEHEHIKLIFNFGGSGALQQQIEQGAPVDLFLSSGVQQMNSLVDKQLVESSNHTVFLENELVIIIGENSNLSIKHVKDLMQSELKLLAVGEPHTVPAGIYAKELLVHYQLWESIKANLVYAKDVRQVLNYVETGNTEAGFVYRTDALVSKRVKIALIPDPLSDLAIEYPMGIIKTSKHKEAAREFYNYLLSKPAQDVFLNYGFSLPEAQ
jgi:molybdate transport system substrate-binding protein